VASVACAKFCLHDNALTASMSKGAVMNVLMREAVINDQIDVLQWALEEHQYACSIQYFALAGRHGHLNVLQLGEGHTMNWYSVMLCNAAVKNGHVYVLEWIHQRHTVKCDSLTAAEGGHVSVLQWMKENDLIATDDTGAWYVAAKNRHFHLLEWLLDNEFTQTRHPIGTVALYGRIDVLLWCREHEMQWDSGACAYAASAGQFGALKWLREHGCPWDSDTIRYSEARYPEMAQWARENGCEVPE